MNAFGNKATNVASGKWVYKDGRQYWQEKDGSYAQGKRYMTHRQMLGIG